MLVMAVFVGMTYSASITITNPSAGNEIARGSNVIITWNAVGTTKGFKITLWKNNALESTIVANFAAGNGNRTYSWTAPNICGSGYQIKIKEKTTAVANMSGEFTVTGCGSTTVDWDRIRDKLRRYRIIDWRIPGPWPGPGPLCLSCPPNFNLDKYRDILIKAGLKEQITVEIVRAGKLYGKAVIGENGRGMKQLRRASKFRVLKINKISEESGKALRAGKGFKIVFKNAKGKVLAEQAINVKQIAGKR